jgi:hypothetical protein
MYIVYIDYMIDFTYFYFYVKYSITNQIINKDYLLKKQRDIT